MRAQPLPIQDDAQRSFLYAYMNNTSPAGKIRKLLHRDIHYIWLAGYEKPDFITIKPFPATG